MKRLLGLLGLTCLVVLTACFYFGAYAPAIIFSVCAVSFLISMLIKKSRENKTLPVMFLTALFAVSLFLGYTNFFINPLKETYDGKKLQVKAVRISDGYNYNGYYYYKLRCTEINNEPANCKLLFHSKEAVFSEIGDELQFTAEIDFGKDNIAPSERIFLSTWIPKGEEIKVVKAQSRNLNYYISSFRHSLSRALYLELDYDSANFSSAVMLGNKHSLDPEVKSMLRSTGLSHISVVSGLHLSVIGALFTKLFRKAVHNKYICSSLSILSVSFFALISGMGISVIRALVMFVIYTLGTMLGRKSDSLNSIGAAALVLTLSNPYSVGDVGMLLSFSATLGIVLWAGKIYSSILSKVNKVSLFTRVSVVHKFLKGTAGVFACNLSATLWTLPVSVLVFKGFSLISIVTNLLVVPFMSAILLCIGLCVITHFVGFLSVLTDALAFVVTIFYDYLIMVCRELSRLPFAYINATKPYFIVWIVATIAFAVIATVIKRRFVKLLAVLMSALVLFSSSAMYRYLHRDSLILHVPYVGSGISVVIESSDGYACISTGGTASRVKYVSDTIDSLDKTKDNVFVSLPGYNCDIYSENLVKEFDYSKVLRYDIGDNQNASPLCDDEIVFSSEHYIKLWDKAQISLIPCKDKVFTYIETGKTTVLIVPGYSDCSLLSEKYLNADVVITRGNVRGAQHLQFDTLIAAGDGKYDDESMEYLTSQTDSVLRGYDITYNIDFR